MQVALLVAAGAAGLALAALAIWAARRYTRATPAAEPVKLEVLDMDDAPVASLARPPPQRARHAPTARPAAATRPPPPSSPRAHPERAPAMVLTQGIGLDDDALDRRPRAPAPAPRAAPPPRPPPKSWAQQALEETPSAVPTEWARRQVGPVEKGRTAGVCGGCAARLSVSNARPLRIACPVCGRTKLLTP